LASGNYDFFDQAVGSGRAVHTNYSGAYQPWLLWHLAQMVNGLPAVVMTTLKLWDIKTGQCLLETFRAATNESLDCHLGSLDNNQLGRS